MVTGQKRVTDECPDSLSVNWCLTTELPALSAADRWQLPKFRVLRHAGDHMEDHDPDSVTKPNPAHSLIKGLPPTAAGLRERLAMHARVLIFELSSAVPQQTRHP
jgi:hypothetical protein